MTKSIVIVGFMVVLMILGYKAMTGLEQVGQGRAAQIEALIQGTR